jgi:4-carboxymuconolactone decarboxylase
MILMSRLDPPNTDALSHKQQEVHDEISAGPRGSVRGPLGVWLWRPEMASKAQALGQYCRYDSSLPPRLSELAILITARYWSSEFEWQHHKPIALDAGLNSELVEAIRVGSAPSFKNDDEHIVFQFATELLNNRVVSDTTYQSTIEALGKNTVVDLVALLGYYGLISMTINVFQVAGSMPDELV